jgi:hypothetical protein
MFFIIGADNIQYGPATAEEVREWIQQGRADGRTLAREEISETWKPLAEFPEFAVVTAKSAPPPVIQPGVSVAPPFPPQGTVHETLVVARDFDVFACLGHGWALLMNNLGLLAGSAAVVWVIDDLFNRVPIFGGFLSGVLYGGLYLVNLKCIRQKPTSLMEVFSGFGPAFPQLAIAGLLMALFTTLGTILFYVPALYLKVGWVFALPLVVDHRLHFWSAMEVSRKVATRLWFKAFLLLLIGFAPYILMQGFYCIKSYALLYEGSRSLAESVAPDFSNFMPVLKQMVQVSGEVARKMEPIDLGARVVLLINMPFAVASIMYAYETLFGARQKKSD